MRVRCHSRARRMIRHLCREMQHGYIKELTAVCVMAVSTRRAHRRIGLPWHPDRDEARVLIERCDRVDAAGCADRLQY